MSRPSFDYTGKNVFVFGGTSGINLGIAHGFARAGANLSVASRNPEKVEAAKIALSHTNPALGFALDVRDWDAVKAAIDAHVEARGSIDVLISGAAGNFPAPATMISAKGFKTVTDIDTLGTYHVMRAAYDGLTKPGASIINISAAQAWIAMPLQVHVCAAKAGIDMITRVLAMEWGGEGIRINSVAPGPIAGTEGMARLAPSPEAEARVNAGVPLGRMGTVDEIADACLFLCSDMARYITGAVIPVDGGSTAGRMLSGMGMS